MRVIANDRLPNSVKTGIQKAMLQDGEIVDYVMEEMINGIGVRAERMYEYARSGAYIHGLPSGQFVNADHGVEEVTAQLALIEGAPVVVDYIRYGAPNTLHMGWIALLALGYVPSSNQIPYLSAQKGATVYLDNMEVVVPAATAATLDPFTIQQWGTAANSGYTPERTTTTPATRELVQPTPIRESLTATEEHLLVTYVWELTGVIHKESMVLPITGYDNEQKYFHAKYDIGGVTKYWMYQDGLGTYPVLDELFDRAPETNGTFFPFAYFRHAKASVSADKESDFYKSSRKLVGYMGMNYDHVAESIDTNPDIEDVEQAVIMFAVPANSTDSLELRYLWTFFNNMFHAQMAADQFRSEEERVFVKDDPTLLTFTGAPTNRIVIQDTLFKMALQHAGIFKKRVAGSIGPVGTYSMVYAPQTLFIPTREERPNGEVRNGVRELPVNKHRYRYQVSTGFYDEITILNLTTTFHVEGRWWVIGNETDSILLIPIDHSISADYSIPERELLYARSMHFVFNSRVVTQLEWYETEGFQMIVLAVMFVLTFYSMGSAWEGLAAAFAAGGLTAAAVYLVTMIIEYIVVALLFKLFVKAVGIRLAFVIAIIAAAYGISTAVEAGSVAGAPFAKELLMLSNGLVQGIQVNVKEDTEDLLAEAREEELLQAEQIKLLDTANELLEQKHHLSPFLIFGETPQEFYNRTVHSGNIGVVGIEAVSAFVDSKLRLPKLNDSFGGIEYE